jgi:imidazolonepropionase-like amidohydrolase
LRAVTLRAAEICRIQDRVGSLEIGKDADFIVLSDDPLSLSARVDVTVIGGRIVYERSGV